MAAARIFGDESVYIPDDFGHLVTAENAEVYFGTYFDAKQLDTADYTKDVPVLMYHNIAEEPNDMTVTPEDIPYAYGNSRRERIHCRNA